MVINKNSDLKTSIDAILKRIANILLLNASFIDNLGLLNGKLGIAIFFYHYGHQTRNKIFIDSGDELVNQIYQEINERTPTNFANGLTGIGWGMEYLVKNEFVQADTDIVLESIDSVVYRNSLYRPFLLESGNDLFGYGLYFIARLREHGNDDNNIDTLFKKQHLIYLADECERILIQKRFKNFEIENLSIDTINSILWFLIEMYNRKIFPFKIENLFHSIAEYIKSCLLSDNLLSRKSQLIKLSYMAVNCIKDHKMQSEIIDILKTNSKPNIINVGDEEMVKMLIDDVWQRILYEPNLTILHDSSIAPTKIFRIIDTEINWEIQLNNLNGNNLGLTGLAGLGLRLLLEIGEMIES